MRVAVIDSGQKYITDGLKMDLDAGQLRSYGGSGTTWTDISANGFNATLTNGPTYNSGNGGKIVFDGTDDFCTINAIGLLTTLTVECWFRPTSYPNNFACVVTDRYDSPGNSVNFKIGYEGGSQMFGGFYDGVWRLTSGVDTALNTWQQIVFTATASQLKIYSNGAIIGTTNINGIMKTSGTGHRLGRRWDTAQYFTGDIAIARIYNRVLTATEAEQNYNAIKSRFGL